MLSVRNLSGGFGDIVVVRDFSAAFGPGEVMFVTGRNGVGKSTLVKLIATRDRAGPPGVIARGRSAPATVGATVMATVAATVG